MAWKPGGAQSKFSSSESLLRDRFRRVGHLKGQEAAAAGSGRGASRFGRVRVAWGPLVCRCGRIRGRSGVGACQECNKINSRTLGADLSPPRRLCLKTAGALRLGVDRPSRPGEQRQSATAASPAGCWRGPQVGRCCCPSTRLLTCSSSVSVCCVRSSCAV